MSPSFVAFSSLILASIALSSLLQILRSNIKEKDDFSFLSHFSFELYKVEYRREVVYRAIEALSYASIMGSSFLSIGLIGDINRGSVGFASFVASLAFLSLVSSFIVSFVSPRSFKLYLALSLSSDLLYALQSILMGFALLGAIGPYDMAAGIAFMGGCCLLGLSALSILVSPFAMQWDRLKATEHGYKRRSFNGLAFLGNALPFLSVASLLIVGAASIWFSLR